MVWFGGARQGMGWQGVIRCGLVWRLGQGEVRVIARK
jgi:hypothetical protein